MPEDAKVCWMFKDLEEAAKASAARINELFLESDRGCAILCAAQLDGELKELHRQHIVSVARPAESLLSDLFENFGPLSTFSARIKIAYCFGLISEADYRDLELMRRVRNAAAHSPASFSLSEAGTCAKVFEIQAPSRVLPQFPELKDSMTPEELAAARNPSKGSIRAKDYFLLAGLCLTNAILRQTWMQLKHHIQAQSGARGGARQP